MVLKQMSPMSVILKKESCSCTYSNILFLRGRNQHMLSQEVSEEAFIMKPNGLAGGLLVCGGGAMRLVSYEATGCITNYKGRLMYINFDIYR